MPGRTRQQQSAQDSPALTDHAVDEERGADLDTVDGVAAAYGNAAGLNGALPPDGEGQDEVMTGTDGPGTVLDRDPQDDPDAANVDDPGVVTDGGEPDAPPVEGAEGQELAQEGGGMPQGSGGGGEGAGETPIAGAVCFDETPVTAPVTPTLGTLPDISDQQAQAFGDEHGMTPEEAQARNQGELDTLGQEVSAKQGELMAEADTIAITIATDIATKTGEILAHIESARQTVQTAFDGLSTSLTASKDAALAEIETHYQSGMGVIDTAESTEQGRLTTAIDNARGQVQGLRDSEGPSMETVLMGYADALAPIATRKKADAVNKGNEVAGNNDPTGHDASGGLAEGKASLLKDVKKTTAEEVSRNVGTRIDAKVVEHSNQVRASVPQVVDEAIQPFAASLETTLDETQTSADEALATARTNATTALDNGKTAAEEAVTNAEVAAQGRITEEQSASSERFEAAGTALNDAVDAAGEEFESSVRSRASNDSAFYAQLLEGVQAALANGGPFSPDEFDVLVQGIYDELTEVHGPNLEVLHAVYDEGSRLFEETICGAQDIFDTAVVAEEDEAERVANEIDTTVREGATNFGNNLQSLGDNFTSVLNEQIAAAEAASTTFVEQARLGLQAKATQMATVVANAQTSIGVEMDGWVNAIPGEVDQQAQPKYQQKLGKMREKATAMRSAMDGMGTDEGAIYSALRDCGYGEIEAVEAVYDDHYAHRAADGMRALRFDLNDEMSGSDLRTALAYLDHNRRLAIELELEDSLGFWNDDEARIEAVLRTCSQEEVEHLNSDPSAMATMENVRSSLGGADLDTVNVLVDQNLTGDQRLIRADAIRVFDAMDGMGTDEARVRSLLENARTPEQRQALREYFNTYAEAQGWEAEGNMDLLETALRDDFGGTEATLVVELARVERNEQAVSMARMLDAGDGCGTQEEDVFSALDDASYAERYAAASPEEQARMAAERQQQLNAQVASLSEDYNTVEEFLDAEMGEQTGISYEEARRGTKDDGSAVTTNDLNAMNLERAVADRKMQTGSAEPDLMIRWAVEGGGTAEQPIKDALGGSNPKSKSAVDQICADYRRIWKETLRSHNELDVLDFDNLQAPSGRLCDELGGGDWIDTRILLCGKPNTPEHVRYVSMMRVDYETSGLIGGGLMVVADGLGFTDTHSDLVAQQERFDEEYANIPPEMRDDPLSSLGSMGERIEELGEYLQADAQAYGNMKASIVDAIVTTLEIVGGIIATVLTAGAASPVLAAIAASLIISAAGIAIRAATLGDRYGAAELGLDVGKALLAAGTAGLAQVKALGDVADNVGNAVVGRVAREAGEQGGARLVGVGWELTEQAQQRMVNFVSQGVQSVATDSVNRTGTFLMDERTYDMTLDDALFGEQGLGASLAAGIPSSFVTGGVTRTVGDAMGPQSSYLGSAGVGTVKGVSGNTAGYVANYQNYANADQFWEGLGTSNVRAGIQGAGEGMADRRAAAATVGREFLNGTKSAADLDGPEYAHFNDTDRQRLAQFVADNGGDVSSLPASYRRTVESSADDSSDAPVPVVATPTVADEQEPVVESETTRRVEEEVEETTTVRPSVDEEASDALPVSDDSEAYQNELLMQELIRLETSGDMTDEQIRYVMDGEDYADSVRRFDEVQAQQMADATPDSVINASFVPGSDFRASTRPESDPAAVLAASNGAALANAHMTAHPNGKDGYFQITLENGTVQTVRVVTRTGGDAHDGAVAETQYYEHTNTHVILMSDRATDAAAMRAMDHEVAEIRHVASGNAGDTDVLSPSGAVPDGAQLSGHDAGRLAEIDHLTGQIVRAEADGLPTDGLHREMQALVEHLGLRAGTEGADERMALALPMLSAEGKAQLELSRRGEADLSGGEATALRDVRARAADDAAASEDGDVQANLTARPDLSEYDFSTPEGQLAARQDALQQRNQADAETMAALESGEMGPVTDPRIGGGASLAGLTEDQLLVDARGRWQQDASHEIAQQSKQQGALDELPLWRAGDVTNGPDERPSMAAVAAAQDLKASQNPTLTGTADLTPMPDGTWQMRVTREDGTEVMVPMTADSIPVIATGFPAEQRLPGNRLPDAEKARAEATWEGLRSDGPDGPQRAYMGDEANSTAFRDSIEQHDDLLIAGAGGTGISAAEIALTHPRENGTIPTVTMLGGDVTDGLDTNPQMRELLRRFGDPSHSDSPPPPNQWGQEQPGKLLLRGQGTYVADIELDGAGRPTMIMTDGTRVTGDAVVAAMGQRTGAPHPLQAAVQYAVDNGQTVRGEALIDSDGRYVGYRITFPDGQQADVTGGASRFLPDAVTFSDEDKELIWSQEQVDAPTESGNYAGGYAPSATQSVRYAHFREAERAGGS